MRKIGILVVLVLGLTGCEGLVVSRGGTRGFLPEIPVPSRPVLQELTPEETAAVVKAVPEPIFGKVRGNVLELQKYARKLEVSVEEYNIYAKVNNRLVREELGLKPETKP